MLSALISMFLLVRNLAHQADLVKARPVTYSASPSNLPAVPFSSSLPMSSGLVKNGIIYSVKTSQPEVALTFDADETYGMRALVQRGSWPDLVNKSLMQTIEDKQVPVTVFLTGLWIEDHKDLVQQMASDPLYELANHSYSHPGFRPGCYKLANLPDSGDQEEVLKTEDLLKQFAPNFKKYFRFPGMCYEPNDLTVVQGLGYTVVHASIGNDSYKGNATAITNAILAGARPGSIIVLHFQGGPSAPSTAAVVPNIIDQLRARGLKFVKVSQLLADSS